MASKSELLFKLGKLLTERGQKKMTSREFRLVPDADLGFDRGLLVRAFPGSGWNRIRVSALREYEKQTAAKPATKKLEPAPVPKAEPVEAPRDELYTLEKLRTARGESSE